MYILPPPPKYPYIIAVVGLVWSNDPESYAGGSVSTGRFSIAGQFEGYDTDKKRDTLVLQVGGWKVRLTTPPRKIFIVKKPNNERRLDNGYKRQKKIYKN